MKIKLTIALFLMVGLWFMLYNLFFKYILGVLMISSAICGLWTVFKISDSLTLTWNKITRRKS